MIKKSKLSSFEKVDINELVIDYHGGNSCNETCNLYNAYQCESYNRPKNISWAECIDEGLRTCFNACAK